MTSKGVSARVFWGAVTLSVVVTLSPPTEGQASTIELRLVIEVGGLTTFAGWENLLNENVTFFLNFFYVFFLYV